MPPRKKVIYCYCFLFSFTMCMCAAVLVATYNVVILYHSVDSFFYYYYLVGLTHDIWTGTLAGSGTSIRDIELVVRRRCNNFINIGAWVCMFVGIMLRQKSNFFSTNIKVCNKAYYLYTYMHAYWFG